jgi:glutamine amidotransferase
MCELYGIISNKNISQNEPLKLFYNHSVKHSHGWGLAYWTTNFNSKIYNEGKCANDSLLLQSILASPIESKVSIGHIRFATVGSISDNNSHPFKKIDCSGREWTLAHNGNIYVGLQLLPYMDKQAGGTDSERILLYLVDCINNKTKEKGSPLNSKDRSEVVDYVIQELSYGNRLNLLIYDTEQFYVHANLKDSLYFSAQDDYYCFASTPLENNFSWNTIPINRLLTYSGIDQIYCGNDHGNEFIKATPSNFDNFNI